MLQYGCTTLFGIYAASAVEAQAYLPQGFRPQLVGDGQASFIIKSWRCLTTVIDGRALGPSNTTVYYLPVVAPESYRLANVSSYFVLIGLLTSGAEEASLYGSWNFTGARQGTVQIDAIESPPGSVGRVAASAGTFSYSQTTTAAAVARSVPFEARYFGVVNGTATNAVDIPVSASLMRATGPAYLEFGEESSPFEGFVGKGNGYHQYWGAQDLSYSWKSRTLTP